MRLIALIVFLVVALGAAAEAETRHKRMTAGSWTSYRVQDWVYRHDGKTRRVSSGCMAEVEVPGAVLRLVVFGENQLVTQVESPKWSFRPRFSTMRILWGGHGDFAYGDTEYMGNVIVQQGSANGVALLIRILDVMGQDGPVTVHDDKDRAIAQFPVRGVPAVLADLDACAKGR